MLVTEEGQISIDFLLGISIFLLTLGFLIQFIPGLFLSTSEEGSLNSVAYRTANILIEDPGWWENNTHNGTDWEDNIVYLSRIGLAYDKTPRTKQTKTPNILNRTKIKRIQNGEMNETRLTFYLGLYDKINGAQVDYGYNITIQPNKETWLVNNSTLSRGEKIPTSQDVFKITRKVLVETGKIASFRADELTCENPANEIVTINISGPQNEDILVDIMDFNANGTNPQFIWAKLNSTPLNNISDYSAYKKTNTSDFFTYSDPLNNTDTLLLIINHTLFTNNSTYQLELKFTQMNFDLSGPPFIEYTANVEPFYESASLVVRVWK